MAILESPAVGPALANALITTAAFCALRAAFILLFMAPAAAKLTWDGYRRMRRDRDSAVLLGERAPIPYAVEDQLALSTAGASRSA